MPAGLFHSGATWRQAKAYDYDGCRRMEDAVKALPESSDLCKKIVLGRNVDDIPGKFNIIVFALFLWPSINYRPQYMIEPFLCLFFHCFHEAIMNSQGCRIMSLYFNIKGPFTLCGDPCMSATVRTHILNSVKTVTTHTDASPHRFTLHSV